QGGPGRPADDRAAPSARRRGHLAGPPAGRDTAGRAGREVDPSLGDGTIAPQPGPPAAAPRATLPKSDVTPRRRRRGPRRGQGGGSRLAITAGGDHDLIGPAPAGGPADRHGGAPAEYPPRAPAPRRPIPDDTP